MLAGAYGGYWWIMKSRIEAGVDRQAEGLRAAGYGVDLSGRRVSGFPFRLKLDVDEARIASPGGWSLAAPGLKAEAYLHDPTHWVIVAPKGLSVVRPKGGGLTINGAALRASVAGVSQSPWRIVLQGEKLTFAPAPGARPFSLASADRIELYLRPAPTAGEGMALFKLEGGRAGQGSLLHRVAADAAVTATLQARVTRPAAFQGRDWGEALRAWGRAGGAAAGLQGQASGGAVTLNVKDGTLSVGPDGRLVGAAPLELKGADKAFSALTGAEVLPPDVAGSAATVAAARASGQSATLNLVFQAGATTLGPVRIGVAPKVG